MEKNRSERFVLDVLAAPGFAEGAVEKLSEVMKNLRIVDVSALDTWDRINSGIFGYNMKWTIGNKPVITEVDKTSFFNARYGMEILSKRQPTAGEMIDAHIAWIGAKAIQSNSFVFVKDAVTAGPVRRADEPRGFGQVCQRTRRSSSPFRFGGPRRPRTPSFSTAPRSISCTIWAWQRSSTRPASS